MSTINSTIELLKKVILDPNCSHMNQSTIKGYLGELLVKEKLETEGVTATHLGNQSGYDLQFSFQGNLYKIDVKFSTLKCEFQPRQNNWGWALVHKNKKRAISCTNFVCVSVDAQLEVIGFYVVSVDKTELFPSGLGRFSGVKHGFILFEDESYIPLETQKFFQLWAKSKNLLESATIRFVSDTESLLSALC